MAQAGLQFYFVLDWGPLWKGHTGLPEQVEIFLCLTVVHCRSAVSTWSSNVICDEFFFFIQQCCSKCLKRKKEVSVSSYCKYWGKNKECYLWILLRLSGSSSSSILRWLCGMSKAWLGPDHYCNLNAFVTMAEYFGTGSIITKLIFVWQTLLNWCPPTHLKKRISQE